MGPSLAVVPAESTKALLDLDPPAGRGAPDDATEEFSGALGRACRENSEPRAITGKRHRIPEKPGPQGKTAKGARGAEQKKSDRKEEETAAPATPAASSDAPTPKNPPVISAQDALTAQAVPATPIANELTGAIPIRVEEVPDIEAPAGKALTGDAVAKALNSLLPSDGGIPRQDAPALPAAHAVEGEKWNGALEAALQSDSPLAGILRRLLAEAPPPRIGTASPSPITATKPAGMTISKIVASFDMAAPSITEAATPLAIQASPKLAQALDALAKPPGDPPATMARVSEKTIATATTPAASDLDLGGILARMAMNLAQVREAHGGDAVAQQAALRLESLAQRVTDLVNELRGRVSTLPASREATIRLDPPSLGHIQIHIQIDVDEKLRAFMTAERPHAAEMLAARAEELRAALSEAGIRFENFTQGGTAQDSRQQAANSFTFLDSNGGRQTPGRGTEKNSGGQGSNPKSDAPAPASTSGPGWGRSGRIDVRA